MTDEPDKEPTLEERVIQFRAQNLPGNLLVRDLDQERCRMQKELDELKEEVADLNALFDIRYRAGQRAIKMWQKATGKTHIWPDYADLCVWLMKRLDEHDELKELVTVRQPPKVYKNENDGFVGTVQGFYTTREGEHGVVLQQIGNRVVHVYRQKWLKEHDDG